MPHPTTWRATLLLTLLALPISAMLALAYRNQPGEGTITVHPDQEFQEIHGWEAVAQASLAELDKYENRQEVLDELLDKAVDFGLTRLRLGVGSGVENTRDFTAEYRAGRISRDEERCGRYSTVNDNDDPNVINPRGFIWTGFDREIREDVLPLARRLEARGEKLWVNVQYTAFTHQICRGYHFDHDRPEEYAEFASAVYQHMRDTFGIVPDTWEVMLEPDNNTVFTPELLAAVTEATAARLQRDGFTPSFVGPGVTNAASTLPYFDATWAKTGLRPFLREMSYHRYGGGTPEIIQSIGDASRTRGVPSSMLEHIGAGADELYDDLTRGNVSAWQQFALSWPDADTGAHYFILDPAKPAGERATLSSTGSYLRQYFRALRPGARRIGADTSDGDFRPIAARNADGRVAVVVRADRAGRLSIEGLTAGAYVTSCWTDRARWEGESDPCAGTVDVDDRGVAVVDMPDAGVFSLVRQPNAAP